MLRRMRIQATLLLGVSIGLFGCEGDTLVSTNPYSAYDEEKVTVIGGDTTVPVANGDLSGEGCLQVTEESCIAVDREGPYCKSETGPVDAVLVGGQVAQVVCYSDEAQKGPVEVIDGDGDGDLDIPQNENGSVIIFAGSSDGKPFVGDVVLDANDVTLYGNGPDKSIIQGNLTITGNNARVRGIRVTGNVTIDLNTAALLLSVVEGNLQVQSNNSLVAETAVFGNFTVTGNNTILVGDGTAGNWEITGGGARCERNYRINDENSDRIVGETERGEALSCPQ